MACFLLHVTDDPRPGPTPALEAGHGRIARRGLREWTDLDGPGFRLRYYPKILDRRPQFARTDGGDFAVDRIRTRNERNLVLSLELLLRTFS